MTLNVIFGYRLKQSKITATVLHLKMYLVTEQIMIQKDNHTKSSFSNVPHITIVSPVTGVVGTR